jgi:hypothetical protein
MEDHGMVMLWWLFFLIHPLGFMIHVPPITWLHQKKLYPPSRIAPFRCMQLHRTLPGELSVATDGKVILISALYISI